MLHRTSAAFEIRHRSLSVLLENQGVCQTLDPGLKPLTESVTDKLSASADFIMRRTPTPFAFPIRYELFSFYIFIFGAFRILIFVHS